MLEQAEFEQQGSVQGLDGQALDASPGVPGSWSKSVLPLWADNYRRCLYTA